MKHLYTELPFSMVLEVITKHHASGKDVRNLVIKNNNDKKGMIIRVNSPIETMNPDAKFDINELMFKTAVSDDTKGTSWSPKIVDCLPTSSYEVYINDKF